MPSYDIIEKDGVIPWVTPDTTDDRVTLSNHSKCGVVCENADTPELAWSGGLSFLKWFW